MPSNTHGNFTFDGPNKRIDVSLGTVQFSAAEIYSRWKDWVQESPVRGKYLPAFGLSVGGDSLGGGVLVGAYYFLQNGWVIRPQEADHQLIVSGNLFPVPDNAALFTSTVGDYQVIVGMRTSSLTQQVVTSGSGGGGSSVSASDVADAVWNRQTSAHTATGTFGNLVGKKLLTLAKFIGLK